MILNHYSPLVQRLIVSSLIISILIFSVYYSFSPQLSPVILLLSLTVVNLAIREYYQIAKRKGFVPSERTGLALSSVYLFSVFIMGRFPALEEFSSGFLVSVLAIVLLSYFIRGRDPLVNSALTLFGFVYLAVPLASLLKINYFFQEGALQDGRWWLCYLLAVTYVTDTAGLFFGKAFGSKKLAPFISPSKTWEGAIAGFLAALAVSLGFAYFSNTYSDFPILMTYQESLLIGGFLSILAQFGDLSESLLKRDVGVKDSSKIPGLGGMLDMVDSLIFTAPALYLYLRYIYG